MQILPPRRNVYGLRAPRVATVSGNSVVESRLYLAARPLRGLGRSIPGAIDPETGASAYLTSSSGTSAVVGQGGVIENTQKLGTLNAEEALGPNVGAYVAGASLAANAAKLAYNLYQAVTDVPLSERDIYIDAGSGGDVGDAGALIKQAEAKAAPTKKARVKKALAEAKADPKQVAAQAAEIDAKAKDPSFWDDFADASRDLYSKCTKLDDAGICIGKRKFNWKVFGGTVTGLSGFGYIAYKVSKGEEVPAACVADPSSTACAVAAAQTEKAKLAKDGVPGADTPVPNPSNEQVLQSWLGAIADADSESEIDNIVEAAKRVGIGGDYLKRIEDAATAAKAKLKGKKTMLYVGLGVGVVAVIALVAANRR